MTAEDEKLLGRLVALRSDAAANNVIELACVFDDAIARIRELSAEVAEAKKDYGCLAKKAREYEDDRDRNAELWEAMKAERDRLAGEVEGLRKFARNCRDNFDCDMGANGSHPHYCRACCAKSALAQAGQDGGTAVCQECGQKLDEGESSVCDACVARGKAQP